MLQNAAGLVLPVATYVLVASCKATVLMAVVLVCRRMLADRISPRTRNVLWLVVLVSLLLPVGINVPLRVGPAPPVAVTMQVVTPESAAVSTTDSQRLNPDPLLLETGSSEASLPVVADVSVRRVQLQSWLALLWAAGVMALAAVLAWSLYRSWRIATRGARVTDRLAQILAQCESQIGPRRPVRLFESADIATPAVLGWWRPALLLPRGLAQRFSDARLRYLFLHELAHVQRHDILVNWFAAVAQVLHWFNPLVWHSLRMMRADMEQACDARVLGCLSSSEHADYGQTLIDVLDVFPGPPPARGLGVIESHAQLKERIVMITRFGSRRALPPVIAGALLLLLASIAATQPQIVAKEAVQATSSVPRGSLDPVASRAPVKPVPAPVTEPPGPIRPFATVDRGCDAKTASSRTQQECNKMNKTSGVAVAAVVAASTALAADSLQPLPVKWEVLRSSGQCKAGVDPKLLESGLGNLSIVCSEPGSSAVRQTFEAPPMWGKRVKFSGWVRTQRLEPNDSSGSVRAGLYIESGTSGRSVAEVSASALPTGSSPTWHYLEVPLNVERGGPFLTVGLTMSGQGQMWVRDFRFEEVATAVSGIAPGVAVLPAGTAVPSVGPLPTRWNPLGRGGPLALPGACKVGVDGQSSVNGGQTFTVLCANPDVPSFGGAQTMFDSVQYRGKRVRVSGWLKANGIESVSNPQYAAVEGGGGLWIGVGSGNGVRTDRMQDRAITGSADWQYRDFVVDVPLDNNRLMVGFWMQGKGQLWARDLTVEEVSTSVPVNLMWNDPGRTVGPDLTIK